MATNPRQYIEEEADKRGLKLSYSTPVLATGSSTPPPSTIFPGSTCYYVCITFGNDNYHGYGPTPFIARTSAELEAATNIYKKSTQKEACQRKPSLNSTMVLCSQTKNTNNSNNNKATNKCAKRKNTDHHGKINNVEQSVTQLKNQIDSYMLSQVSSLSPLATPFVPESSGFSLLPTPHCLPLPVFSNIVQSSWFQPTSSPPVSLSPLPPPPSLPPTPSFPSPPPPISPPPISPPLPPPISPSPPPPPPANVERRECTYNVPRTAEEAMNTLMASSLQQTNDNAADEDEDDNITYSYNTTMERNLTETLVDVAYRKGYIVQFEIEYRLERQEQMQGNKYVVVKAIAGPMTSTGSNRRKNDAKRIASLKLLQLLKKCHDAPLETASVHQLTNTLVETDSCSAQADSHSPDSEDQESIIQNLAAECGWPQPEYITCSYSVPFKYFMCVIKIMSISGIGMGDTEECAKAVANSHIISTLIECVSQQEEINSFEDNEDIKDEVRNETMKQDNTPLEPACSQSPLITISVPHSASQALESKDDQFISSNLTSCASQISADDTDHQLLDETMLTQVSSDIVFSQSSNTTDQCCSQIVSDISSQGTIRELDHVDADIKTFYDQLASQISSQEFSLEINDEYSTDSSSSIDFDALLSNSVSAVSHDTDSSHYEIKYEKETEDVNGEVGHITLLHHPGIALNSESSILQFESPVVNPVLASVLSHADSELINQPMLLTISTEPGIAGVEAPNIIDGAFISEGPPGQLLFVSDGSDDESEVNELNVVVGDEGACCIPSEGSLL
ncbi:PREDICTED: uncharacterized protein LOC109580620 [Amphimedon queenslandica]|uniref:DRBM domain-containing protein n=1 Tax=Amphimedon queenslandica TaxID=400682 RepID=A0A1X7VBW0_AMPQE|nr:PREDICTED: uncharacterized protein LOC109580620 [Amphimedon queenslandica]|eukprot:XP_019849566.1 PREDICTED: uncharacterized protein LOC109580620 [Amphimedon queenslandica]